MRRLRLLSVALVMAIGAGVLQAQGDTVSLLQAPHVAKYLRIRVLHDDSTSLAYRADATDDAFFPLPDDFILVASQGVSFRVTDFNPLVLDVTLKQALEDDASYKSVGQFLDQLAATGKAVGFKPADDGKGNAAPAKVPPECLVLETRGEALRKKLDKFLEAPDIDAKTVIAWTSDATGYSKTKIVLSQIQETASKVGASATAIRDDITVIKSLQRDGCSNIDTDKLKGLLSQAAAAVAARDKLKAALDEIAKRLDVLVSATDKWRDGAAPLSDYELDVSKDTFQKNKLTLSVVRREYTLKEGVLTVTSRPAVNHTFIVRHYCLLCPDTAAAAIYSDLRYPSYGTKQVGGATVVDRVSTSSGRVDAAVLLGLVCRCWSPTFVYPQVHVGISSAKDFPGFLIGAGLRFTNLKDFSISGGRMFTWYKDLDKLTVGGPVSGTAELNSDLRLKRAPTTWYGALQYSFK